MEDRPVSGDTSLLKTSITAVAHSRAISSYTWINKYIYLPLQCMFIIVHCSREGIKKFIWWVHHLLSLACEQALHLGVQLMKGSDFPSTRTTNSVRLILGSQYSIGNPTLSHVQLCEKYINLLVSFFTVLKVNIYISFIEIKNLISLKLPIATPK